MSKYKFKNAEVEKALRLVADELDFSDDEFDEIVKSWAYTARVPFLHDGVTVFSFSTDLLEKGKEFNPNGWNDSDVIPPEDEDDRRTSKIMLIENDDNFPYKGYFDFDRNCWCELGTYQEIECLRYRSYPTD